MTEEQQDNTFTLTITLDEHGIPHLQQSQNADLFTLIVMASIAHQMLTSQYFQLAAAQQDRIDQFRPKLLVPTRGA